MAKSQEGATVRSTANAVAIHDHNPAHAAHHSHAADEHPHCICAAARITNGWCAACQVGYVASVPIKSADLFDAIDAHGHDYKPHTIECESCRAAIANSGGGSGGGFCDRCGLGFANGQLFCSHLSYTLARGTLRDPASIRCANCRANSIRPGWCDRCNIGMVGSAAFTDRAFFDAAAGEHQRLLTALNRLDRCEPCAVVMFTRGECPSHGRPTD